MNKNSEEFKDNYWDSKPNWCRPWTIIISGLIIVLFSIYIIQNIIIRSLIILLIIFWWILFLYLVPSSYKDSV